MNRPNTANASAINRPNAANPGAMNRGAAPSNMNRGGDRGYSTAVLARWGRRSGGSSHAPGTEPWRGGNSAFSNSGSAKSERVASNRGQASMGGAAAAPVPASQRVAGTASN